MKADISEITRFNGSTLDLEFNEVPANGENLAEGFIVEKPVSFKGLLTNVNGMLHLTGRMDFEYKVPCFRCLKDVEDHIEVRINENFVNSKDKDEELDAYVYTGNFLELDKAIEDNIILNLPMKKLCSQDCKGLCRICGADLNEKQCGCVEDSINPQMEKLRDYLNN
jgi:uncharacterized protein